MNNPIYRISDMGATQKYIKVNTPCAKKIQDNHRTLSTTPRWKPYAGKP